MAPEKYLFIDNVRFWAMAAVVALHTAGGIAGTLHAGSPALVFTIEDLLKFGTIGFFLVSGFLLGDRFESSPRLPFLARRVRKVFLPWLFWFTLQVAYFLFGQIHAHNAPLTPNLLARVAESCLVATAFWFVPNLIFSIAILLLFRPLFHDLRLGAALLAISLFYALNIYTTWLPTSHTIAPFGFLFFLWLGAKASHTHAQLTHLLARTPTALLLALVLLTAASSLAETRILAHRHSIDPTNSLRLTNQLFSIAAVLFFAKPGRRLWPSFLNVQTEIFGVYLTLTLILALVETSARHLLLHLPATAALHSNTAFLLFSTIATALVAALCVIVTKLCARVRSLAWIVGAPTRSATPAEPSVSSALTHPNPSGRTPAHLHRS